jgi:hypothetical protein
VVAIGRILLSEVLMFFEHKHKIDPLFDLMKFRRSFGFFGAGFWEGKLTLLRLKSASIFTLLPAEAEFLKHNGIFTDR